MDENPIVYPIELGELTKIWLDFGWRLHVASIGEDGLPTIHADEAMSSACDAVALGASSLMIDRFKTNFLDPEGAALEIARRAEAIVARVDTNRAAATTRTADIYAQRFGVAEPRNTKIA